MLKPQIIFCHGFGLDQHYWQPIIPFFKDYQLHFWDLGYFNEKPHVIYPESQPLIGIGHSLGMIKLLSSSIQFQSVIGLNAFTSFLGYEPQLYQMRRIEIQQMQKQFHLRPERTLTSFYQRAGITFMHPQTINTSCLSEALNSLNNPFELTPSHRNLLIIGSQDDPIVPQAIILDNCRKHPQIQYKFLPYGQHALGQVYVQETSSIIREFIHATH
jgi:pimeloyl-[acyl-carrier protein] methyl ester esterase